MMEELNEPTAPRTDEQRSEEARAATERMQDALRDFINAIADDGEPETALSAVVLFESHGMAPTGIFHRRQHVVLEYNGGLSSMLGMLDLTMEQLQHDLRCPDEE